MKNRNEDNRSIDQNQYHFVGILYPGRKYFNSDKLHGSLIWLTKRS